ncbi:hypothetical protein EV702DRAFT_1047664 [Suillus placidus]|uniref:Uncharacterized protein n=1 Tax=Suillus placidus TaxID=48579 RepID=A0A9P6ZQR7_9AGAM|nr:hypothetical protein EV702DRAFT_1047664 [Suillus placidus]
MAGKSQPLKFTLCDPSKGRRKRCQATLKLDGFVYHTFDDPVESPGTVNDTAMIVSTSTDAQLEDKPATEEDHSCSQGNLEIAGVRLEPSSSLVVDRVWHDDSQSADDHDNLNVATMSQAAAAASAPTTIPYWCYSVALLFPDGPILEPVVQRVVDHAQCSSIISSSREEMGECGKNCFKLAEEETSTSRYRHRRSKRTSVWTRPLVFHRQAAITRESGIVLDFAKHSKAHKSNKIDELALEVNLSVEAKIVLQSFALLAILSAAFLCSLLKDIKPEHLKRIILGCSTSRSTKVTNRGRIICVLKQMRQAMDEKPKIWNELQAGIDSCLTQLLLLIDIMSSSAIENTGTVYIRKKMPSKRKKTTGQALADEYGVPDVEKKPDGDSHPHGGAAAANTIASVSPSAGSSAGAGPSANVIAASSVKGAGAGAGKFANSEITKTLLTYLSRYRYFDSPEFMKRAVNLIHRQVVKAKADGFTTLDQKASSATKMWITL